MAISVRIVSLLPSATDIACALGLERKLVGVSHSCDAPAVAGLPRVTRTRIPHDAPSREIDSAVRNALARGASLYELEVELLRDLAPDLVLTQDLCDVCAVGEAEVATALRTACLAPSVLTLGPRTLTEVWKCIRLVGHATGRARAADALVAELEARVGRIQQVTQAASRPRVVFLEWLDPPIVGGHWNPEMVGLAGGTDVLGTVGAPSRAVTWDDVVGCGPDVLCVACCGLTIERARADLVVLRARFPDRGPSFPGDRRIAVFDGVGLFSRPGPRLAESLECLAAALHPRLFAD
jgi:iron complex transport system substrate-binding protein